MARLLRALLVLGWVSSPVFAKHAEEQECVIDLTCAECIPDNMPLVTSHAATDGRVRVPHGDEVTLSCAGGRFVSWPLREAVTAACAAGVLRARPDAQRTLLDLGCQEDVFEDVQHSVEWCGADHQGRAYRTRGAGGGAGGGARHVAVLCFDADAGAARWARACNAPHNALPLPPHADRAAPLTLLGNFNHMFDARTRALAERLYSDGAHMTRRLRELVKHDDLSLGGQELTAARLLAPAYFEDQTARVADFVSNQAPAWASVAAGNLRHAQADVAALMRRARSLGRDVDVYAGTHGTWHDVRLRAGRFPVPLYFWTIVHERRSNRALAIVVLNDPLVAVSEIRGRVFCESVCAQVSWAGRLRRRRRWETPLLGLAFCCEARAAAAVLAGAPAPPLAAVPPEVAGLLLDIEPSHNATVFG